MSETFTLAATQRDSFGKGVARKLRAAGRTPVVVYGHGTDPQHLSVETHPLSLIVRHPNALISLDIEGTPQLVLVKDVQRDPVRQVIEHVDLVLIRTGEQVEVEVPVHIVGTPFSGTNALQELNSLRLSVPAANIREYVEIDVEGLEAGSQIHAGEIALESDETLLDDSEQLVVHVVAPRGGADDDADADDEAAE